MPDQDNDQIYAFHGKGRSYLVTRYRHTRGKDGGMKSVYWLARTAFPSHSKVKIKISAEIKDTLGLLNNTGKMLLSEMLITKQLCQDALKFTQPKIITPPCG